MTPSIALPYRAHPTHSVQTAHVDRTRSAVVMQTSSANESSPGIVAPGTQDHSVPPLSRSNRPLETRVDRAKASGVRLGGADLANASLVGADLTDAQLNRANITNADLTTAVLTRVVMTNTIGRARGV